MQLILDVYLCDLSTERRVPCWAHLTASAMTQTVQLKVVGIHFEETLNSGLNLRERERDIRKTVFGQLSHCQSYY